ncbi:deoxyribose-phosphate aldolase [Corynebacterium poyangense]|uniref:Deoxyribose-phosphate aldolase n=1 Tax=Corynebacterium poyangense TaxID=2684405 RepID=A0A7H0SPK8_9CORY|nr:deoxyribose-phosphate aldolase [Corynebacterium poyangense]QNQ90483.1 deoxyribose-phosphate aldolase [Corynebacterium poyangense]
MKREELAQYIDHTLLKPETTPEQVKDLVAEAAELGTYSVCISPSLLPVEVPDNLKVATVCGFPSGAHDSAIKAAEARDSVAKGAAEVDMVINVAYAKTGDFLAVEKDIRTVREAIPGTVLKVIVETAALSDEEITECCLAAERAGAEFVKTSTGFHPAGGASVHAVELMNKVVGGRLGIKASGGIRETATALAMIKAGATRLGCSSSRDVIEGL